MSSRVGPSPAPHTAPAEADAAPAAADGGLSLGEHVCLALVAEGASHGWAVGSELGPQGDIGRVWSLSRPLTYRALDLLTGKGLVARRGRAGGRGRDRIVLEATAEGQEANRMWLDAPVRHLRDVRTELLVKLTLRTRAGLDTESLLAAQQAAFEPHIEALTTSDDADLVDLWRRESARAVRRFLSLALRSAHGEGEAVARRVQPTEMRLSARNQVRGTITEVHHSGVMSTVKAVLGDGQPLTAAITRDAAEDLDLASGDAVLLVVKSTEVMVAKATP